MNLDQNLYANMDYLVGRSFLVTTESISAMTTSTGEDKVLSPSLTVADGAGRQDITLEIRRRILTGQYAPGQRIPPERQLEEEFGCSRLTVAKAMTPLVADGLIERYRGRGTFVSQREVPTRREIHMHAGQLSRARGNVIKYISPGMGKNISSSRDDVLTGLHGVLNEAGYHVSIDFYGGLEEHLNCLAKADDLQIAGLVVWPVPDQRTNGAIAHLVERGVPLVLIDTYLPELNCDYVVTDNITGAAMMVNHLAQLGHRRICYLTPDERRTSLIDRMSGFLRGMVEAGLPIDDHSVTRLQLEPGAGGTQVSPARLAEHLDRLLALPEPPTALFTSHDVLAIAMQSLLRGRDVRVPEEITVVGYDGIEAGEFCAVPLTTIKQDFLLTAQTAGRILLERFGGRGSGLRYHTLIPPQLLVRASSALKTSSGSRA
jgi:GntR family transcriptional regulator, arabinose operon transcriptional repressor